MRCSLRYALENARRKPSIGLACFVRLLASTLRYTEDSHSGWPFDVEGEVPNGHPELRYKQPVGARAAIRLFSQALERSSIDTTFAHPSAFARQLA